MYEVRSVDVMQAAVHMATKKDPSAGTARSGASTACSTAAASPSYLRPTTASKAWSKPEPEDSKPKPFHFVPN